MDVKMLKFFMSIYENRSINKAAKELMMTSQGVCRILNNIEDEVGSKLFSRNSAGVIPYASADILYEDAKELIGKFEMIQHRINQNKNKENNFRIACAKGVLNALSIQVITAFAKTHKEYRVTWEVLSNNEVKEAVKKCRAEVGLVVGPSNDTQINESFFTSRDLIVLIYEGHPLYEKKDIEIEDFEKEKIIILNEQFHLYHEFTCALKKKGIVSHEIIKVDDSQLLFQLCQEHMGIGILIDFSVEHFDLKGIRVKKLEDNISWDIYKICHMNNSNYDSVKSYFEFL